jgi:hypothetical protein
MGGLSGHMMHPHDNLDLRIKDFKRLIQGTLTGLYPMTEKFDGFNIHVMNWNGTLRFARNFSDMKNGGFVREDIEYRFKNEHVREVFMKGWDEIEKNNWWKLIPEFNESGTTANCEIIIDGTTNIMPYPLTQVVVHDKYIWSEDGSHTVRAVEAPRPEVSFEPFPRTVIPYMWGIGVIRDEFEKYHLTDDDTLEDYYRLKFVDFVAHNTTTMIEEHSETVAQVFNRFFERGEKVNLREIRKGCDFAHELQELLDTKRHIIATCKEVLDMAILSIGTSILSQARGLNFQAGRNYSACAELEKRINKVFFSLDLDTNTFFKRWNYCDRKIFGIEGVVVEFNGNKYKWTGPFAPINQLLGGQNNE